MPTLSPILFWLLNGLLVLAYAAADHLVVLLLPPLQRGIRGSQPLVFSAQVIVKQAFSLSMIQRVGNSTLLPRVSISA